MKLFDIGEITGSMGLSSNAQQQTSTMKLILLLLAILHASEAVNGEVQLIKRDAHLEEETCLNQSNKWSRTYDILKHIT